MPTNLTAKVCYFLENGNVYAHYQSNKMVGLGEWNYGDLHKIELVGKYTRKEVKIIFPHARFVNFNDLGKHRFEREKITELEA